MGKEAGRSGRESRLPLTGLHQKYRCSITDVDIYVINICIMAFVRPVQRILPDGQAANVRPYHISYEGLEKCIICRDDEDCDTLVKCIAVCAHRKNVIVIIYAVVSNHAHIAVLARSVQAAEAYAAETK